MKSEIDTLLATNPRDVKRVQLSRIKSKLQFLRVVEAYFLSGLPSEEFIKKEIERIEGKITRTMNLFDASAYKEPKTAMNKFEKENHIPHLRDQLRALRFILN